ncbi:hypothetical protein T492DRAFT_882106 [Pavlovales sp. CCMP2436]|nr:hypothetical protein T492DRAFT_882106 [Pavlovales sp. CCMP2436]
MRKQLVAAHASLSAALALNPASAISHNNLGCIERDLGRRATALNLFSKAVEMDPLYLQAATNRNVMLSEFRQPVPIAPACDDRRLPARFRTTETPAVKKAPVASKQARAPICAVDLGPSPWVEGDDPVNVVSDDDGSSDGGSSDNNEEMLDALSNDPEDDRQKTDDRPLYQARREPYLGLVIFGLSPARTTPRGEKRTPALVVMAPAGVLLSRMFGRLRALAASKRSLRESGAHDGWAIVRVELVRDCAPAAKRIGKTAGELTFLHSAAWRFGKCEVPSSSCRTGLIGHSIIAHVIVHKSGMLDLQALAKLRDSQKLDVACVLTAHLGVMLADAAYFEGFASNASEAYFADGESLCAASEPALAMYYVTNGVVEGFDASTTPRLMRVAKSTTLLSTIVLAAARVDRLAPRLRMLLKVLAVFAGEFPTEMAAAIAEAEMRVGAAAAGAVAVAVGVASCVRPGAGRQLRLEEVDESEQNRPRLTLPALSADSTGSHYRFDTQALKQRSTLAETPNASRNYYANAEMRDPAAHYLLLAAQHAYWIADNSRDRACARTLQLWQARRLMEKALEQLGEVAATPPFLASAPVLAPRAEARDLIASPTAASASPDSASSRSSADKSLRSAKAKVRSALALAASSLFASKPPPLPTSASFEPAMGSFTLSQPPAGWVESAWMVAKELRQLVRADERLLATASQLYRTAALALRQRREDILALPAMLRSVSIGCRIAKESSSPDLRALVEFVAELAVAVAECPDAPRLLVRSLVVCGCDLSTKCEQLNGSNRERVLCQLALCHFRMGDSRATAATLDEAEAGRTAILRTAFAPSSPAQPPPTHALHSSASIDRHCGQSVSECGGSSGAPEACLVLLLRSLASAKSAVEAVAHRAKFCGSLRRTPTSIAETALGDGRAHAQLRRCAQLAAHTGRQYEQLCAESLSVVLEPMSAVREPGGAAGLLGKLAIIRTIQSEPAGPSPGAAKRARLVLGLRRYVSPSQPQLQPEPLGQQGDKLLARSISNASDSSDSE